MKIVCFVAFGDQKIGYLFGWFFGQGKNEDPSSLCFVLIDFFKKMVDENGAILVIWSSKIIWKIGEGGEIYHYIT